MRRFQQQNICLKKIQVKVYKNKNFLSLNCDFFYLGKKAFYSDERKLILEKCFFSHQNDPYPTSQEKNYLAKNANLTVQQVSCWMAKAREKLEAKCSEKYRLTTENKNKLLEYFKINQDPGIKEVKELTNITGLDDKRIYQNIRNLK